MEGAERVRGTGGGVEGAVRVETEPWSSTGTGYWLGYWLVYWLV
jgi:hypothetical protein